MAKRTGLQSFLNTAHYLCGLFGRYRGSIVTAIDASNLSLENKNKLKDLMAAVDTACSAIEAIRIVWEK